MNPQSLNEWSEQKQLIQIGLGVFAEIVRESVRNGVNLALSDAFSKTKK